MKNFVLGLTLLLLPVYSFAQELKDPIRLVYGQRVNLQPLFLWWTNAATLTASNATRPEAEQLPLPVRPLKAWVRITSNELTNNGFAWFARAQIQELPDGPVTNQIIVIRHGPVEEKKALDRAVGQFNQATDQLLVKSNEYVIHMDRATALSQKANLYQEMYEIDPCRHLNLGNAANVFRDAATQAQRNANTAARRIDRLNEQRIELYKFTQGRDTLTVDSFALRTGEKYQNLPVFDLGLMFGR